jgi:hypothetical protein
MFRKIDELRKKLQAIPTPVSCDLLQNTTISTIVDNSAVHLNSALNITQNGIATQSSSADFVLNVRIPKIIVKSFSQFDTKTKNEIFFFCVLKSLTKSDYLKFKNYSQLLESFGYSKKSGTKFFKRLQQKKVIEINKIGIKLVSYQKFIEVYTGKKIKRQHIKFIDFTANGENGLSEIKKRFFECYIKKNIEIQKKQIERKVRICEAFQSYECIKLKKINKKNCGDSVKSGATLLQFFSDLERKKSNDMFVRYAKRYAPKKIDLSNYFKNTLQMEQIARAKDFYAVILTSRNFSNKLGYSHTLMNSVLNEIDFNVQRFKIEYVQQVKMKKQFRIENFYQFSEKYYYARLY